MISAGRILERRLRGTMRLFIAINLSEEMKEGLLEAQGAMMEMGVGGNYTKPENLHLTMAFIGEFGDPDLVKEVVESIDFAPFSLAFDGVGTFRSLWWAGVEKSDQLHRLAKRLRRALAEAGIPFDRKKFSPHITLIRRPDRPLDGQILDRIDLGGGSMIVDHLSLMRSDRGKHGMIYTEL